MSVPSHLTISLEGLAFDSLLSEWRWLVDSSYTPVLMTAFGDLFLRDEAGRVHFLDVMAGEFKQVAASQEEFERMSDDRGQRRNWFIGFLLLEVRKLRGELAQGECYSCEIPLSLGGQLEADNFERTDLQTHFSVLGQVHRQTKHLPPGTSVKSIKTEAPKESKSRGSWWQRLMRHDPD